MMAGLLHQQAPACLADCRSGPPASHAHAGAVRQLATAAISLIAAASTSPSNTIALLQVLTNTASFEKAPPAAEVDSMWNDGSASPKSVLDVGAKPASHKLVVRPRFDYHHGSHGCPLCPANLCKVGKHARGLTRWKAGALILSRSPVDVCRSVSIRVATPCLWLWGCAASESQHGPHE